MANINLRPWREELREEKKNQFLAILFGVVILAAGVVFLGDRMINGSIDDQNRRNNFIKSEITKLDKQIAEIKNLRERREQLLARMRVIQALQGNRPIIVRLFDEIVRTLPGGVHYTSLRRSGDIVSIVGTAESNTKVSSLMRKLDASDWFAKPALSGVRANPRAGEQANDFTLTVKRVSPKSEEEKEGPVGGAN